MKMRIEPLILTLSLSFGIGAVIALFPQFTLLVIIVVLANGSIIIARGYLKLRSWEILFLLLWASGLVFRTRDLEAVETQLLDTWALYRVGLVVLVSISLVGLITRTDILRMAFRPPLLFFFLLALWQIISTLWSVQPLWSLYRAFEYLVNVALIALIATKASSLDNWRRIMNVAWFVVLLLLLNIWFQSIFFPERALEKTPGLIGFRIGSFLPVIGGNGAGELGALLTIVAFARLSVTKSKSALLALCLGLISVIFAESRSPFVGLIAGIASILVIARRTVNIWAGSVLLSLVFLLATPFADVLWKWFLRGQAEHVFLTLTGRLLYWQSALELLINDGRLLTGYGAYGASRFVVFKYLGIPEETHLHNAFVETLLGSGLIGVTLFWLGLIYTWLIFVRLSGTIRLSKHKLLLTEIVGALSLWTVRAFFSSAVFVWHPAVLYLTAIGFAVHLASHRSRLARTSPFAPPQLATRQ